MRLLSRIPLIRDFWFYRRARKGTTMVVFIYPDSSFEGQIRHGVFWLSEGTTASGFGVQAGPELRGAIMRGIPEGGIPHFPDDFPG